MKKLGSLNDFTTAEVQNHASNFQILIDSLSSCVQLIAFDPKMNSRFNNIVANVKQQIEGIRLAQPEENGAEEVCRKLQGKLIFS